MSFVLHILFKTGAVGGICFGLLVCPVLQGVAVDMHEWLRMNAFCSKGLSHGAYVAKINEGYLSR